MSKCYNRTEWLKYKMGEVSVEQEIEMEEHLSNCANCMEEWLSLITQEELDYADSKLSPAFNDIVIARINHGQEKIVNTRKLERRNTRRKNLLIYYAAAASITLFIMGSGVFTYLIDTGPKISRVAADVQQNVQRKGDFDIAKGIVSKTAIWIEKFEANDDRR